MLHLVFLKTEFFLFFSLLFKVEFYKQKNLENCHCQSSGSVTKTIGGGKSI